MLILAFTFFSWTGSPGRKFCIMLKHNGRESVILSESDIKYYDWDRQGICLSPEGIKQIKKVSVNLLTDTIFCTARKYDPVRRNFRKGGQQQYRQFSPFHSLRFQRLDRACRKKYAFDLVFS
jgi:hypothetical protein